METILPFLCFHTVPLCDESAVIPRGRHVCREDCEMVANICQDEYFVFRDQRINGTLSGYLLFEANTKYISSNVLKISEISRVLMTL